MTERPPTPALSEYPANALVQSIRRALDNPIADDSTVDPAHELAEVLETVGLDPTASGGAIRFTGRDPIVSSVLPLATMAAVALMAKAASVPDLWRFRGLDGQDLSVDLGQVLHRLCPFYDRREAWAAQW